jgi:serine O-acetyltransferase
MDKTLKNLIYSDLLRYCVGTGLKGYIKGLIYCPGFRYMAAIRKAKYYRHKNIFLYAFYKFRIIGYSHKYGFQIPYSTQIGKGFYIGHFGRIIVNPLAIIGNNVNLSPGVTIGMTNRGEKKGVPTIGNEVWVGTNAVIVGNIRIGNNVLIAPNAYVNNDVDDNSIVIGNPAKITFNENATKNYIDYKA